MRAQVIPALGVPMNSMIIFALVTAFEIAASANADQLSTSTLKVGAWRIESAESYREGEIGALLTTHRVFQKSGKTETYRGTFVASSAGDGGESWDKEFVFESTGSSLLVTEKYVHLEPQWETPEHDSIFFEKGTVQIYKWDGQDFLKLSSGVHFALISAAQKGPAKFVVNGNFSDSPAGPGTQIVDVPGVAIGAANDWGKGYLTVYIQVRLPDGRVGYVKQDDIRIQKIK